MCKLLQLEHTVCFHRSSLLNECAAHRNPTSLLTRLNVRKCKLTVKRSLVYELCHDCRRFFTERGYTEFFALRVYEDFRSKHSYYGELIPHEYSNKVPPTVLKDEELFVAVDIQMRTAALDLGKKVGGKAGKKADDLHRPERELLHWVRSHGSLDERKENDDAPGVPSRKARRLETVVGMREKTFSGFSLSTAGSLWLASSLDKNDLSSAMDRWTTEVIGGRFGSRVKLGESLGRTIAPFESSSDIADSPPSGTGESRVISSLAPKCDNPEEYWREQLDK
jgi:hypothetical protein